MCWHRFDFTVDILDDGLTVQGIGKSLAHVQIIERGCVGIKQQIIGTEVTKMTKIVILQSGITLDHLEVCWRQILIRNCIHFTLLEGSEEGRRRHIDAFDPL